MRFSSVGSDPSRSPACAAPAGPGARSSQRTGALPARLMGPVPRGWRSWKRQIFAWRRVHCTQRPESCGHRHEKAPGIAEEKDLKPQHQGGEGAVCHPAEEGNHANSCGIGCRQPQQGTHHTAKGGPNGKAGHNFAPLESRAQGQRSQQQFKKAILGAALPWSMAWAMRASPVPR